VRGKNNEELLLELHRHNAIAKEIVPLIFHKKELKGGVPETIKVFNRLQEWAEKYEKVQRILDKYETT